MPEMTFDSVELASAYDELSDPQFTHGKELIALLNISRGDRVLDIGCGTGRLAAFAVERVGAEGRILGVDPAPPRIQLALQRGDRRLEFRIGQAQDLSPFGDATFDVAYMNSVVNWIDDRPKAFAEAYRVLKSRGRLGVATTVRDRPNQLRLLERRAWRIATGRGADKATDNSSSEQCGPKFAATAAEDALLDWSTEPEFATATFGDALSATDCAFAVWSIEFVAFCDWSIDWLWPAGSSPPGSPPAQAVPTPAASTSARLATSTVNRRFI